MSIDIEIKGETKINCNPYSRSKTLYVMTRTEPDYVEEPTIDESDIENDSDVVQESLDSDDYISRCHYGALVINTKDVFIADVDISRHSNMSQLRSKKAYLEYSARISDALINDFVVYETCKGFRVIMLSDTCDPTSNLSQKYMELFLADKLYAHNCVFQECYRARLTPKPQRMGMTNIEQRPWTQSEGDWIEEYETRSSDFCVTRLVAASNKNNPLRFNDKVMSFLLVHEDYTESLGQIEKDLA